MDASLLRDWMAEISSAVTAKRDYLTQLDAAIGDADHGVNLHRGFSAVQARLDESDDLTPGQVLVTAGSTLVSKVGGAAGPLYGTALRQAGKALGDTDEFDEAALLRALQAGLEGVRKLGAAAEGDKTMIDAFAPAVAAFAEVVDAGGGLLAAAERAERAAEEGMTATVPLQARKGRASYLGPRSVGHQDPGATSTAMVFSALRRAAARARP